VTLPRRCLDAQTALALVLELQEQNYTASGSHRRRTRHHLDAPDDLTL